MLWWVTQCISNIHIRLNKLCFECHWIHEQVSTTFHTSSLSLVLWCWLDAALELPLVIIVSHYLSLLAIVCQTQSCWSKWRTLGCCLRRCQTWTHLQDKHRPVFTCCPFCADRSCVSRFLTESTFCKDYHWNVHISSSDSIKILCERRTFTFATLHCCMF